MAATPVVLDGGEGERRWFYGGGLHTWKVGGADSDGSIAVFEDELTEGKLTPWHRHPDSDEVIYLIEGQAEVNIDGVERRVGPGALWFSPRGVPHAFRVVSPTARLLAIQTPSTAEPFYRNASEPAGEHDGQVDFAAIGRAATATGATDLLGPPPFVGA